MSTATSSNARHPDACHDWGDQAGEIALIGYYGGLNQKLQNSTGYWTNSGYWKKFDDEVREKGWHEESFIPIESPEYLEAYKDHLGASGSPPGPKKTSDFDIFL